MSMGINGVSQVGAGTQYDAPVVKSSEEKLSKKAQDYLADLRSKHSDYDFIIANDSDDKYKVCLCSIFYSRNGENGKR